MKPAITFEIVLLVCVLASVAHSQDDSTRSYGKWRLDIEIGKQVLPVAFNDFFGLANWNHKYTVRVGIGKDIQDHLTATASVEYRRYASSTSYGELFPWIFLRSFSRTEYACYAALTAYGFLQAGIGVIAQSHEEIAYYAPVYDHPIDPIRTQPAAHRVKLFYLAGLKYDIPLGARFYIPIGLSMDMFLGKYDVQTPTFRLGLTKEFN